MTDRLKRQAASWLGIACLAASTSAAPAETPDGAWPSMPPPQAPVQSPVQGGPPRVAATRADVGTLPVLTPAVPPDMDEYQIGPHDLLEISVLHVPEATRTVRVNTQGLVTLPLIGSLRAGGLTAGELEAILTARLAKDILKDPQVTVFIKEAVSHRVLVDGSVVKLGVYPLAGNMTLMQVIGMAGGIAPLADPTNVRIFRQRPDGTREIMTYNLEAIQSGEAQDPLIKSNDVVIVGKSASAAFVKSFLDTIRGFVTLGTIPLIRP